MPERRILILPAALLGLPLLGGVAGCIPDKRPHPQPQPSVSEGGILGTGPDGKGTVGIGFPSASPTSEAPITTPTVLPQPSAPRTTSEEPPANPAAPEPCANQAPSDHSVGANTGVFEVPASPSHPSVIVIWKSDVSSAQMHLQTPSGEVVLPVDSDAVVLRTDTTIGAQTADGRLWARTCEPTAQAAADEVDSRADDVRRNGATTVRRAYINPLGILSLV